MINSPLGEPQKCVFSIMRRANLRSRARFLAPKARDIILTVCLGGLPGAADAQTQGRVAFDIPAQPLDKALVAFGTASGLQIFYENSLTSSQRSTAVKGELQPRAALRILLWGSGLAARVIAVDTISVVKPNDGEVIALEQRRAYLPYYGIVQSRVMKALCQQAQTRPGNYHLALQYWINPAGEVARLKLIGSSRSRTRDAAITEAMRTITLPRPGDMPQPVTMVIEPTAPAGASDCPSGAPRASEGP